jgi:hypothetical protein
MATGSFHDLDLLSIPEATAPDHQLNPATIGLEV